ncbi:hypothetical protein IWX50DRAFT_618188 [Phyllosticta citricarpa]|uniref:Uncharacterized protein n=1 Tax=Phyllosticta citricarpa TaxID=55181 RepID=A0ABR1MTG1_9PEZI
MEAAVDPYLRRAPELDPWHGRPSPIHRAQAKILTYGCMLSGPIRSHDRARRDVGREEGSRKEERNPDCDRIIERKGRASDSKRNGDEGVLEKRAGGSNEAVQMPGCAEYRIRCAGASGRAVNPLDACEHVAEDMSRRQRHKSNRDRDRDDGGATAATLDMPTTASPSAERLGCMQEASLQRALTCRSLDFHLALGTRRSPPAQDRGAFGTVDGAERKSSRVVGLDRTSRETLLLVGQEFETGTAMRDGRRETGDDFVAQRNGPSTS